MRVLYIYNPYSAIEKDLISRLIDEVGNHIELIEAIEVNEIKDKYKIRETPALVIIRDDLQGEQLLQEDVNGKLLLVGEVIKALEEEDANFRQSETNRLDNFINAETTKAIDDYTLSLIDGGIL